MTWARRMVAEAIGTAFLLATVVGSGIMGDRLSGGNVAIALMANTVATGAALVTLILTFGPISGAHFNPAVTLADASQGGLAWREVPIYLAAQISGAFAGVAAAHLMFSEPVFFASRHARSGVGLPAAAAAQHDDGAGLDRSVGPAGRLVGGARDHQLRPPSRCHLACVSPGSAGSKNRLSLGHRSRAGHPRF